MIELKSTHFDLIHYHIVKATALCGHHRCTYPVQRTPSPTFVEVVLLSCGVDAQTIATNNGLVRSHFRYYRLDPVCDDWWLLPLFGFKYEMCLSETAAKTEFILKAYNHRGTMSRMLYQEPAQHFTDLFLRFGHRIPTVSQPVKGLTSPSQCKCFDGS